MRFPGRFTLLGAYILDEREKNKPSRDAKFTYVLLDSERVSFCARARALVNITTTFYYNYYYKCKNKMYMCVLFCKYSL